MRRSAGFLGSVLSAGSVGFLGAVLFVLFVTCFPVSWWHGAGVVRLRRCGRDAEAAADLVGRRLVPGATAIAI
ncbi:hypothetical protein [Streptomyces sp. NPDC002520]